MPDMLTVVPGVKTDVRHEIRVTPRVRFNLYVQHATQTLQRRRDRPTPGARGPPRVATHGGEVSRGARSAGRCRAALGVLPRRRDALV